MDCIQGMKHYPDKWFDLAIVDPPYGINRSGQTETFTKNPKHKRKHFENKGWDLSTPEMQYFTELFRVSKEQIIWGANYFTQYLPASMGWIFWDKGQDLSMSDGDTGSETVAVVDIGIGLFFVILNLVINCLM